MEVKRFKFNLFWSESALKKQREHKKKKKKKKFRSKNIYFFLHFLGNQTDLMMYFDGDPPPDAQLRNHFLGGIRREKKKSKNQDPNR